MNKIIFTITTIFCLVSMAKVGDTSKRLCELRNEIRHHDKLYYVYGKPAISDKKYDQLFSQLQELESKYPKLITPDSPTQRISANILTNFVTKKHQVPMLSLAKCYSLKEFYGFFKKEIKEFCIEPKIDGVSIELRYENGALVQALTRGDGNIGSDVTANVRTIKTVPLRLLGDNPPKICEVRGEIFINFKDFTMMNKSLLKSGKESFATPRNASCGSIKLFNPKLVAKRPLQMIAYATGELKGITFTTQEELLKKLQSYGFQIPQYKITKNRTMVEDCIKDWQNRLVSLPYPCDGIVIKANSIIIQKSMGNARRFPRWAVAYKFNGKTMITTIQDITWQIGRTGRLTPVAVLEPIELGRTTIRRATLYNLDFIIKRQITVGDKVIIKKAGDVIPSIIEVAIDSKNKVCYPKICPHCDSKLSISSKHLTCPNIYQCPGVLLKRLLYICSSDQLNIKGFGEKTIITLIKSKKIVKPQDLFLLIKHDFNTAGFGENTSKRLLESLQNIKPVSPEKLLSAIGIPSVGMVTAKKISGKIKNLDDIITMSHENLQEVLGISAKSATNIRDFFNNHDNQKLLMLLKKYSVTSKKSAEFANQYVAITGKLENFTRKEIEKRLKQHGATICNSISHKTTILIIGKKPGRKLEEAKKMKIKIINEEEFSKLLP